ncbi:MAG: ribose-phosphate pyrophosphokinase [Bacillota bacterium]|nr:ribose-phosphate pyrophosphokinase [Bacillota bacterium]
MITHDKEIKIFAANSNKILAEKIADILDLKLSDSHVGRFSDGEINININDTVRGSDVFVIQSTCEPVNENLMELLIMIDALKRSSAGHITAVIPYYGYARQDRKAKARDPISAKLVADLLTAAGANAVMTMDLHAAQIQGFFNIPVVHLVGAPILTSYYSKKFKNDMDDIVIVSPDFGSVTRARNFAEKLNVPIAIVDKRRPKPNVCEVLNIIGEIKNKKIILIDDVVDTAGTLVNAASALIDKGAKEVYACCTHPVLSGPAIERLQNSVIKEIVVLDTIPLSEEKQIDKIKVLSVSAVFAEAIERVYEHQSVSAMFI